MSFRDALHAQLKSQGVEYNDLRIDKNDNYKGRDALAVGFIINGFAGPLMFDTTITDDLKLDEQEKAWLVANNAVSAYKNYVWDRSHETEVEK